MRRVLGYVSKKERDQNCGQRLCGMLQTDGLRKADGQTLQPQVDPRIQPSPYPYSSFRVWTFPLKFTDAKGSLHCIIVSGIWATLSVF